MRSVAGAGPMSGPFSRCTALLRFVGAGGAPWGRVLPLRLVDRRPVPAALGLLLHSKGSTRDPTDASSTDLTVVP